MRNKAKRLSALGATALVALVVIGPTAASAQVTTTTGEATTTTLPEQKSVHGSRQSPNACVSRLDPEVSPPGTPTIGVTTSADAFGQPHLGKQITLSNTKVTVSVPASILQLGVDAGLVFEGQQIPSVLRFVIAGAGTTQKTKTFTINSTVTVHVTGGVAQPLTATVNLPDSTWTPVNDQTDVFFSEKSMVITSTLDLSATLGIIVTATFTCTGNGATFIALGGQGPPGTPPTTSPPPVVTTPSTAAPAPAVTGAAVTDPGTLPRTGSNAGLLLAVAVGLLTAGAFALKATSRRSDVARSRNS